MRTALMVGLSLFCATAAEAAIYNLTYERSLGQMVVNFELPTDQAWLTEPTGYEPAYELMIEHEGDLSGMTFDLAALDVAGALGSVSGFLTFGSGSEVAAWDIFDAVHEGYWVVETRDHSDAREIPAFLASMVPNPPAAHYGLTYADVGYYALATEPGRWSCLVDGEPCGQSSTDPVFASAPIPFSGLLLLSGIGMLAFSANSRRNNPTRT